MLKGAQLKLMTGGVSLKSLPPELMAALTSVQVTSTSSERSGFQLTFALGKTSPVSGKFRAGFFDPPKRVVIFVIVKGSSSVLMDGVITRHEVSPSNEPGQSKLTITGEDLTRMMDIVDLTGIPYPAMPPSARVALSLLKYSMFGVIPKVIPSVLVNVPNPIQEIPTQVGTDLEYFNSLANRVGYVFYLQPGPDPGMSVAYWGPEVKTGKPQHALTINSDAHDNAELGSISFEGFSKTLFVVLIHEPTTKIPIPIPIPDINPLNPPLGRSLPVPLAVKPIPGLAKFSPLQAAMVAMAKAARSADVISGSGSLDVMRYGRVLKSRQLVSVRGATEGLDGLYYVRSVTHDIKPGEYKQKFTLSRNAFFPNSDEFGPGVPSHATAPIG